MPTHPEYLAHFDAALRGGPLPSGLTARDPAELERRFAVHRNTVAASLTAALALRFPVIQRLVGTAFFARLARLYAEADRPRSPVLGEWGGGFAEFVAGFAPLSAYPYLADVARIEFARGVAYHAADARPVDPAVLAAADSERVTLSLHPSVRILHLAHPAVSIWTRSQPDGQGKPMAQGPEIALILRDASFSVPVRALGAGDATLIGHILAGASLSAAAAAAQLAEAAHDPTPILVALMRSGAIVDVKE